MGWLEDINVAIRYIESNLDKHLTPEAVAKQVKISPFYFQKGFKILCGLTVSEYIRNRRLSLAGRDLQDKASRVVDVAIKYGYDSPDSFTKAFTRFHGITPLQVKNGEGELRNYLPLQVRITMQGGFGMDCKIVKKPAFKVVGTSKVIKMDEGYQECPKFWSEIFERGLGKYIMGTYAICLDDEAPEGSFKYVIADDYDPATEVIEELEVIEIPENTWAVFPCKGAMPDALQKVNTQIFEEWLPGNPDYELVGKYNVEYYTNPFDYPKGNADENYYCEIWMPVRARK